MIPASSPGSEVDFRALADGSRDFEASFDGGGSSHMAAVAPWPPTSSAVGGGGGGLVDGFWGGGASSVPSDDEKSVDDRTFSTATTSELPTIASRRVSRNPLGDIPVQPREKKDLLLALLQASFEVEDESFEDRSEGRGSTTAAACVSRSFGAGRSRQYRPRRCGGHTPARAAPRRAAVTSAHAASLRRALTM